MQGKIIGGYSFISKKSQTEWVNLFVEVPTPSGGFGVCAEKLMCSADRLPAPLGSMINKNYFISTQNNFASDFFQLPDTDNKGGK